VQDITDPYDYSVIVCSTDGLPERETRFLRSVAGWVSGLILHPYHLDSEHVSRLSGGAVPAVILGDFTGPERPPAGWDQVVADNQGGAQMAVEHLIGLGHRRIAYVRGAAGTPSSLKRFAGYQQALGRAALPLDEALVVMGDYTHQGGRGAMGQLLSLPQPPTAVFCANDLSALGALEVAQLRGRRVPGDVSIVGFDDIDPAALAVPPLTTVSLPPRRVGTIIAETLLERLQGRLEPIHRLIRAELVIRQSTAPPAGA
jgi:DNA-binding LacI/PurR family transcriptional regulator